MIANTTLRLVYLGIPKNGSTSMGAWLTDMALEYGDAFVASKEQHDMAILKNSLTTLPCFAERPEWLNRIPWLNANHTPNPAMTVSTVERVKDLYADDVRLHSHAGN